MAAIEKTQHLNGVEYTPVALTSATAISWDYSLGQHATLEDLAEDATITLSNLSDGDIFQLAGTQDSNGGRYLTIEHTGLTVYGDLTLIGSQSAYDLFLVEGRRKGTDLLMQSALYSGLSPTAGDIPTPPDENAAYDQALTDMSTFTNTGTAGFVNANGNPYAKWVRGASGTSTAIGLALPTSGDYIFYVKIAAIDTGSASTNISIHNGSSTLAGVSLGYNWATSSLEPGRVSFRARNSAASVPVAGPLGRYNASTPVEVAMHYSEYFGGVRFFVKESGKWELYGNVECDDPYGANVLISGSGTSLDVDIYDMKVCRPNYVSIGDSICKGATLHDPDPVVAGEDDITSTWQYSVNPVNGLTNTVVCNYGVGGETSAQILSRMAAMMTATAAPVVFLHCSTNDNGAAVPYGTRTTNINSAVSAITGAGGSCILLNSVYPNVDSGAGWPANAAYYKGWWDAELVNVTGTTSKIDIMRDMVDGTGEQMETSYTQADGVHPTVAGYAIIGSHISESL